MLVASSNTFHDLLGQLEEEPHLSLDCEATGLRPYHGDRLFSIIIATPDNEVYFNFNAYPGIDPLDKDDLEYFASWLWEDAAARIWFLFNAKYDMALLAKENIFFPDRVRIHDVKAIERVCFNDLPPGSYSLDDCAHRRGWAKDDAVKRYCDDNKLFDYETFEGKKVRKKAYHYERVPFDLIVPYACKDARLTFDIGQLQLEHLKKEDLKRLTGWPKIASVYANECDLTPVVFEMEQTGVLIDREYCKAAIVHHEKVMTTKIIEWEQLTGKPWKKSNKLFKEVFADEQAKWGKTKPSKITQKVGVSFDKDTVLPKFENPAAGVVIEIAKAKADIDYYHGFLYHADKDGRIHTSFNQDGTDTGRFSSSSPNLQNLKKPDGDEPAEEFVVRRAIVPDPGTLFVMMDFDQLQFRMMLDYANAKDLIQKILTENLDVHQATANIAGLDRQTAKTVNFSIIFGAGPRLLAKNLMTTEARAKFIRDSVFRAAPEIQDFLQEAAWKSEKRGYVFNWLGRKYDMPNPRLSYTAPNKVIQGGEADLVKIGMVRIAKEVLSGTFIKMVLQVHDELVFTTEEKDLHHFQKIKEILESVYPYRHLPLTVGISHSYKNLADKVKGLPNA